MGNDIDIMSNITTSIKYDVSGTHLLMMIGRIYFIFRITS